MLAKLKLRGLQGGRTIITTIHQPSSRMFHMFDKLLLIAEGYPVYYGKAGESLEYFSALRFIPQLPMNPAEFLLDLATGQVNDISVPPDLLLPQGQRTLDSEKAVIQVRLLVQFFTVLPKLFVLICISTSVLHYVSTYNSSTKASWRQKKRKRIIEGERHQNIFN